MEPSLKIADAVPFLVIPFVEHELRSQQLDSLGHQELEFKTNSNKNISYKIRRNAWNILFWILTSAYLIIITKRPAFVLQDNVEQSSLIPATEKKVWYAVNTNEIVNEIKNYTDNYLFLYLVFYFYLLFLGMLNCNRLYRRSTIQYSLCLGRRRPLFRIHPLHTLIRQLFYYSFVRLTDSFS